ncbi:MAG: gephyrin-like molybdotransferase Glp [Candidatus Bipolaricaulia bacterium]
MDTMITIDEAFAHYEEAVRPLPEETVALADAQERVLSRNVTSRTDLPPFPQSAMDGYALRTADVADANEQRPARLHLVGEVPAGSLEDVPAIGPGEAMRIFTGGHLPHGANAVLRQEDAQVDDDQLLVCEPLPSGQDYRLHGEEIQAGHPVVETGTRLTFRHIAALANSGLADVVVHRAPRVAVMTTGDEVVEPGQPLQPGQVYDANTPLMAGWLRAQGLTSVSAQTLPDTLAETEAALAEAFERADMVITTGGVSVGDYDVVIPAAEGIGMDVIFWKVQQKPGKPLVFAVMDGKVLLGLPGNPGSAFACLLTHGRRLIDLMEGESSPRPRFGMGKLAEPVQLSPKREWWARCRVQYAAHGEAWLEVLEQQASHMIANLGRCEALARVPIGDRVLEHGHPVLWMDV